VVKCSYVVRGSWVTFLFYYFYGWVEEDVDNVEY